MEQNIELMQNQIKANIQQLINSKRLDEAAVLVEECFKLFKNDPEIYSLKAVLLIMQGELGDAERILLEGQNMDKDNFHINYNLGYLYEKNNNDKKAWKCYKAALVRCVDFLIIEDLNNRILKLELKLGDSINKNPLKIAFFVKQGLDSFLGDIIEGLQEDYEVKKIIVKDYKNIDEGMEWADICWFEWCDELVAYGSKHRLAGERKIMCRLHSYEAFTEYPASVDWNKVDKLIFVAEHIRNFVVDKFKVDTNKTVLIANGIDIKKWTFNEKKPGFNIAFVGYINYKKGPMLLIHTFKAIYDKDHRYKLYIAGQFQDERDILYYNQMIEELDLKQNVFYEGWQENLDNWLNDKDYVLCTSVLESQNISVMQAMAKGIKPIIHNFVGARNIYDNKYIWNTIDECIEMIYSQDYYSNEYRGFIKNNYSLDKQMIEIEKLIKRVEKEAINELDKVISNIEQMLKQKRNDFSIKELTLIIPTYNRALTLKSDIEKGFKFGKQRKIIVDDCSNDTNVNILRNLTDLEKNGIENIIFHSENKGVASAITSGINKAHTKYVMFSGDDDIILYNNKRLFDNDYNDFDSNGFIMIPRFVINLDEEDHISIGYDRKELNGLMSLSVLEYIFKSGEMSAFNAGAFFKTNEARASVPENLFRVSEDYVLLSRTLASNLNRKIKVTENFTYVRRVSSNTMSKQINSAKLSIHLLSLLVSGYYCLKENLITREECKQYIKNRGQVLQDIYGYGSQFADFIITYISNQINLEEFVSKIKYEGISNDITINNVPIEFIKINEL